MKYEWVPHEVRQDHAEGVIAYIIVGVLMLAVPAVVLVCVLAA